MWKDEVKKVAIIPVDSGGSWGNSLVGLVMAPLKATFFCVSRARDRTIYIREIVG